MTGYRNEPTASISQAMQNGLVFTCFPWKAYENDS